MFEKCRNTGPYQDSNKENLTLSFHKANYEIFLSI
jgi:hypothetical protein